MTSPIHDCLDGERPREELSVEERDELAALEAAIALVVDPLRAAPAPDLSARVLARVAELGEAPALEAAQALQAAPVQPADLTSALRRALAWLWAPRRLTIRVRPAFAMMIPALAVAILGIILPSGPSAPHGTIPQVYVQFRLEAEGAARVELAGSFTGWRPEVELRESAPGVWSILLPAPDVISAWRDSSY
jgi:hypothetical protein